MWFYRFFPDCAPKKSPDGLSEPHDTSCQCCHHPKLSDKTAHLCFEALLKSLCIRAALPLSTAGNNIPDVLHLSEPHPSVAVPEFLSALRKKYSQQQNKSVPASQPEYKRADHIRDNIIITAASWQKNLFFIYIPLLSVVRKGSLPQETALSSVAVS